MPYRKGWGIMYVGINQQQKIINILSDEHLQISKNHEIVYYFLVYR